MYRVYSIVGIDELNTASVVIVKRLQPYSVQPAPMLEDISYYTISTYIAILIYQNTIRTFVIARLVGTKKLSLHKVWLHIPYARVAVN